MSATVFNNTLRIKCMYVNYIMKASARAHTSPCDSCAGRPDVHAAVLTQHVRTRATDTMQFVCVCVCVSVHACAPSNQSSITHTASNTLTLRIR